MTEHIKIGDITPRIHYTADGTETVFPYPFPVFHESDPVVYVGDTLKTITTDYAVTGVGNDTGGTIEFTGSPGSGETVTITRQLVIKRTSDFQESGEFRARVINDELDRIVAMVQENADALKRTVHLPPTDTSNSMILPSQTDRAGAYLAFDNGGEPIGAIEPGSYPATAFMATVLDDANAAEARATLGALAPDGDGSRLSGITGGGPSIGVNGIYRTNALNVRSDVEISDHKTTFTADAGADTVDKGTDDDFLDGDPVYLTTTGTLPAGLSTRTGYHVVGSTAATLQLSATYGGSAIDITDSGTGTHTIYEAINAGTFGPSTVENGVTVTVPVGSTLTVTGG